MKSYTIAQLGFDPRTVKGAKRESVTKTPNLEHAARKAKTEARAHEFKLRCKIAGLPQPVREYRFDATGKRHFALDFAWPDEKVGLEESGGIWTGGAHGRGKGIARDQAKQSLAASQGWRVLHVQPKQLNTDSTIALVRKALAP